MTRYTIGGDPNPDCRIADTGEPAGTFEGRDYWAWEAGGRTWFLYSIGGYWLISETLDAEVNKQYWVSNAAYERPEDVATYEGYNPGVPEVFYTGNPTATLYEPPEPEPEKLLVLEWLSGPYAGKYTVLKERL